MRKSVLKRMSKEQRQAYYASLRADEALESRPAEATADAAAVPDAGPGTPGEAPPPGSPVSGEWTLPKLIKRWAPAPWLFAREALGMEPDDWQDELFHAVVGLKVDGTPLPPDQKFDKLALKACKGPGKTCAEAVLILWFLTCFEDAKVICTSITGENLRDNLWTELAIWIKRSPLMDALFEWQTERVFLRERPATWYASARTWPKDANSSKQNETLAGIHGRHTMLVVDESGSIPVGILSAGLAHHLTKDPSGLPEIHITLQAGNPTATDGSLGWACIEDRKNWWVKEITGDPDDPKRAKRIDIDGARAEIEKWGRDHDIVRVNILGLFPKTQGNKLVGIEAVRAAMAICIPEPLWQNEPRIMGVDVARSLAFDPSTCCRRQGQVVFPILEWRYNDLMQVVGAVALSAREFQPVAIFIDMIGLGSGVLDRLLELGFPAIGVNSALPSLDIRFENKRAEMYFNTCREITGVNGVPRLALPNDAALTTELTTPPYHFSRRGKLIVDSKDEIRKKLGKSTDRADALVLTYAEPVFGQSMQSSGAFQPQQNVSQIPNGFAAVPIPAPADQMGWDYNPYEREW